MSESSWGQRSRGLLSSAVDLWGQRFRTHLKIVGVVLTVAFLLPWGIGDDVGKMLRAFDVSKDDDTAVMMAWDYAAALAAVERNIREDIEQLEQKSHKKEKHREALEALKDFTIPASAKPVFLFVFGIIMLVLGFAKRVPNGVIVVASFVLLLIFVAAGGWYVDFGRFPAAGTAPILGRIALIAWGIFLIGVFGALKQFWGTMPAVRTGVALLGAVLIGLGLLLPVELAEESKPLLVWIVKALAIEGNKSNTFYVVYTAFVVFPVGAILLAMAGVILALRPTESGGSPWDVTVPAEAPELAGEWSGRTLVHVSVGLLVWGHLISAAILSVAIEGVFMGGIYYAVSAVAQLTWAMCLAALVLAVAGFVTAALVKPAAAAAPPGPGPGPGPEDPSAML